MGMRRACAEGKASALFGAVKGALKGGLNAETSRQDLFEGYEKKGFWEHPCLLALSGREFLRNCGL